MKGETTIQLFDASTQEKKYEVKEQNFITNAFKNCTEAVLKNALSNTYKNLFVPFLSFKPSDLSGGLVLWDEPVVEDANVVIVPKIPVAYAYSEYTGEDKKRGNLNVAESGPIVVDGTQTGYKWVWDFATSNGNCTFKCLSLTNQYFGVSDLVSGLLFKNEGLLLQDTDIQDRFLYAHSSDGAKYKSTNTGYKKVIKKQVSYGGTILDTAENNIVIANYSTFSKPHLIDGFIYIIAKNETDNVMQLLKLNKDSSTIVTTTTLTGVDTSTLIKDFGLAGEYILYNISSYGMSVYNTTSGAITLFNPMSTIINEQEFKLTGFNNFIYDGSFFCTVGCAQLGYGGIDFMIMSDLSYTTIDTTGKTGYVTNCIEGLPVGFSTQVTENGNLEAIKILPQTVFTINNLSAQVTKTPLNTMKIIYTLTW